MPLKLKDPGIALYKSIGSWCTTSHANHEIRIRNTGVETKLTSAVKKVCRRWPRFRKPVTKITIFHCNSACIFGKVNGRNGKMPEFNPSYPGIFDIIQIDGHPTMIFVFKIIGIVNGTQSRFSTPERRCVRASQYCKQNLRQLRIQCTLKGASSRRCLHGVFNLSFQKRTISSGFHPM